MPAGETKLFNLFDEINIKTTTYRHPRLHTVEESRKLRGEILGEHCKSLFLKDKKDNYLLVVMSEDRALDMKALFKSQQINVGRLSFVSADKMFDMLGIKPGAVTPFCLINVKHSNLKIILDKQMMEHDIVNYHPLHNEATTSIKPKDLLKFIHHFNFNPTIIDFDNLG